MIESKFLLSGQLNTKKNNTHFKTCFKLSSRLVFFWANSVYKEMSGTHSSNSSCRPLSCSFAWNQDFAAIFSSSTKRTEMTQSRPQGFSVFLSFLAMLLYILPISQTFSFVHTRWLMKNKPRDLSQSETENICMNIIMLIYSNFSYNQKVKLPWDLHWQNKANKLKISIDRFVSDKY